MNGRIYDPQLGRFLQPDPVIQDPTNAQSWNAYTYVFNNPLAYTDPSGMMSERAWNNVWRVKELEGPSLLSKWVAAVSSSFGAAVQFIWRRCPTGWVSVRHTRHCAMSVPSRGVRLPFSARCRWLSEPPQGRFSAWSVQDC